MRKRLNFCILLALALCFVSVAQSQEAPLQVDGHPPVHKVGKDISPPRVLQSPRPIYPKSARKSAQGKVILWLIVDEDGKPRDVKVAKGLESDLDEAAVEAVRKWTFQPAVKNGHPIRVQINVEVDFQH